MSRVYLSRMYESDWAGVVRLRVIWDGSYGCTFGVVIINIEVNVVQGVNFKTENFKTNCLCGDHLQIAWRKNV